MTFNVLSILLFEIYHFNWQTKQAADSLRNVIETKIDIHFEAEVYSFQKIYKTRRNFVSLILSQQEKGEKTNMEIAIMQPPLLLYYRSIWM